jgi:hypothetical protein
VIRADGRSDNHVITKGVDDGRSPSDPDDETTLFGCLMMRGSYFRVLPDSVVSRYWFINLRDSIRHALDGRGALLLRRVDGPDDTVHTFSISCCSGVSIAPASRWCVPGKRAIGWKTSIC